MSEEIFPAQRVGNKNRKKHTWRYVTDGPSVKNRQGYSLCEKYSAPFVLDTLFPKYG